MDWKKTLGNLAPVIGSAFGPLGTAGGVAVRELLGLPHGSTDEQLDQFLQTPEGALKAKQADYDYQVSMATVDRKDRDSARKMQETALTQDDKFSKRFIYYFAIFWSTFSAIYISFITFANIPPNNVRFADTILGLLIGTGVTQMFNYFYGSTSSSKAKDSTIYNMASK